MTKHPEHPTEDIPRARAELVTVPAEGSFSAAPALREGGSFSSPTAQDEEGGRRAGVVALYLHAFRRHWPLAITLGLFCAAAAAIATYFLTADRITATSLLQISASEQQLVPDSVRAAGGSTFEIYKGTQQQWITSEVVFTAALRKPDVAAVPVLQKEDDPIRWLARNVRVELPPNTEIMRVSLTCPTAEDAIKLVDATVEAYMNEAVDRERNAKRARLAEIDKLYTEKETELRTRRTELRQLAEQLGSGDTAALAQKQHMALQEYAEARNELSRLRSERRRAEDDLRIKEAWLAALKKVPQSAPDLEADLVAADQGLAKLKDDMDAIDTYVTDLEQKVKEPELSKMKAQHMRNKQILQKKFAERGKEVAKKLKLIDKNNLDPMIAELKTRVEILKDQEILAIKDVDKQRKTAEQYSSSIDVEMMRSEVQYLEKQLAPIADERERLKVELRSTPRITVFQKASCPKLDSRARLQSAGLAGFGGLAGVILLILWWDVRKQRINSLSDLSRGLGLTVVGAVPLLPKRLNMAKLPAHKHRRRLVSLDHAVDGIAARIFLRKEAGDVRVVLISSATQGEGKTSLAVHLARRLARTGERTLLVDFDLRRPAIHRMFGLSRGPGVGECLEQGVEPEQVAQPSETENLSIITAGSPLTDTLGLLSNGVTTAFFEKARAAYTFVIVDASPILPVTDGLLASQHADRVILSVRRDTSQAPQVLRACEKLTAFGSRKYVVVLNGSEEEMYGGYGDGEIVQAKVKAEENQMSEVRSQTSEDAKDPEEDLATAQTAVVRTDAEVTTDNRQLTTDN